MHFIPYNIGDYVERPEGDNDIKYFFCHDIKENKKLTPNEKRM